MKKSTWLLMLVVMASAVLLAACGGGGEAKDPAVTVPEPYASMQNPVAGDAAAIAAGKEVFATNCATCHGDTGKGDGPSSAALDPKPADLADDIAKNDSDQMIHWVISEGGTAAGMSSSMPAFKGVLSEDQLWQVTSLIKSWK